MSLYISIPSKSSSKITRAFSESFDQKAATLKSDEQVGAACLELALGRERIRRDVKTQGPNQDAVDYETLEVLRNAQLNDPQFVEAEAIFRRLATDPVLAGRYYNKLITNVYSTIFYNFIFI